VEQEETVTIRKSDFEKVAIEAFRTAACEVIERMTELAPPEHRHIIRHVGRQCLAELEA
jgi:hypothetical protein